MRALKDGDRVTVLSFNESNQARCGLVFRSRDKRFHATAIEHPICWLGHLDPDREGLSWARGWDTPEALALRAAAAL